MLRHAACPRHPTPRRLITALSTAFATLLVAPLPGYSQSTDDVDTTRPDQAHSTVALPATHVTASADTTTQTTHAYTVDQTSAATGLPLSLRDTPQSVTVVTQQRMTDQQMTSVSDVLRNTTGVSAYNQDGEGGRITFYSRGFEITNFTYDGMPTSALPNTFVPGDGIQDTAFYDRVEVVRGATGLMSGTGNPSASINLVRKHALKDFAAAASVSAGSWDNYRGALDISTPLTPSGNVRARIIAVGQDSRSFLDHDKLRRQSLYGVVDADLTRDTTVSLGYQYSHASPKGMPWGGQPMFFSDGGQTSWPRSTNLAASWSTWESTLKTAFADIEHRFDNGWKLRAELSQRRADSDAKMFSALSYPDRTTGQGLIPLAVGGIVESRQNSFDVMATGPFTLLGRRHELTFGAMMSDQKADDRETGFVFTPTPIGNFYQWTGAYPEPDWASTPYALTKTHVKQSGAYGAVRWNLAAPLKLILGARLSNYEVDQGTFHFKQTAKFLPYAGVVYDIDDTYSAYASYTTIFNPQTYRDRDGNVLAPTSGKNAEIGLKGAFLDGRLNASVALFDAWLDNVAQTDTGHSLPDGSLAYYAASGTRSKGIELDIQGEWLPGWNVYAGASQFTASSGDGSRLNSQIPRATVRLFTTYRLPGTWHRLTVGGGVNWQSSFSQSALGPDGAVQVGQGAYAITSLMARYDVTSNASVAINVNNLFDKRYYTMTGFYNQALYGEPRNVMVTLSYRM
ncbi:TonB-dependent siderophore receptor [Pandoraea sp. ISTKB]|uniref:TonB-dependent siderophore receptor n=1 Tax=Pandoraea sp. ISTKB TaxID=1586708 RepID=UPI001F0A1821|nr:TonB-dependent siderophore receptor [Pandoraea sp. ISTKB]